MSKNKPELLQLDFGFDLLRKEPEPAQPTSKRQEDDFVFDLVDCIKGPVIVWKSAWQRSIPPDLLTSIPITRMQCLWRKEKMASITEVVAYMMPRTLESPMSHEWTNIYGFASMDYLRCFKSEVQQEALAEIVPSSLSAFEQQQLDNLRLWIYRKRREALKLGLSKAKKEVLATAPLPQQKQIFDKDNGHS